MATTEPFIGNLVSRTRGTWKKPTIVPVWMQRRVKNSFKFSTGCTFYVTRLFPLISLKLSLLPCSFLFLHIIREKCFSPDSSGLLAHPCSCPSQCPLLSLSLFTVMSSPILAQHWGFVSFLGTLLKEWLFPVPLCWHHLRNQSAERFRNLEDFITNQLSVHSSLYPSFNKHLLKAHCCVLH